MWRSSSASMQGGRSSVAPELPALSMSWGEHMDRQEQYALHTLEQTPMHTLREAPQMTSRAPRARRGYAMGCLRPTTRDHSRSRRATREHLCDHVDGSKDSLVELMQRQWDNNGTIQLEHACRPNFPHMDSGSHPDRNALRTGTGTTNDHRTYGVAKAGATHNPRSNRDAFASQSRWGTTTIYPNTRPQ